MRMPLPDLGRQVQRAILGGGLALTILLPSTLLAQGRSATPSPIDTSHPVVVLHDEAWINDIGTLLYADDDLDGYFSGLSLSIDGDSAFTSFRVYVVIDIISEPDLVTGAAGERLYTTRDFDLYGYSIADEYRVDIDLVQNYSPGVYDLRISLVDAHSHRVLDTVGANDFRNLRALPLESLENQTVFTPVIEQPPIPPNDDIIVTEYAAGSSLGGLAGLLALVLLRHRRRTSFTGTSA